MATPRARELARLMRAHVDARPGVFTRLAERVHHSAGAVSAAAAPFSMMSLTALPLAVSSAAASALAGLAASALHARSASATAHIEELMRGILLAYVREAFPSFTGAQRHAWVDRNIEVCKAVAGGTTSEAAVYSALNQHFPHEALDDATVTTMVEMCAGVRPSPPKSPARSPVRSPVRSPARSPVRSPARSPVRSPSPRKTKTKTKAKAKAKPKTKAKAPRKRT